MTEALRHSVQSLLKDREQQMFKISALEGTGPILFFMYSTQSFKIESKKKKKIETKSFAHAE